MYQVPGSLLGTTMIELDASTSSVPQGFVRDWYVIPNTTAVDVQAPVQ